jgi:hypothetical protein
VTHFPFIAAAYALGIGVPGWFGLTAWTRLRTAAKRLAAVDPRQGGER